MNFIIQELHGGLGNKLFKVLNLISLSKKYNKHIFIKNDHKEYKILSNINQQKDIINLGNYEIYVEKKFSFHKIVLQKNKNYLLSGYFQSYKYFWDEFDNIKKYLNICSFDISKISSKKIIALHIRLGNYLERSDYHYNLPYSYFYKILNLINYENEYQLILFSDDIEMAQKIFKDYSFKIADDFFKDEEDQFLFMSHCHIIIGSNSTFSLCASYLNEIYKFNMETIYYFPNIWFAHKGPNYDINDLIPNQKNYIISCIQYTIVLLIYHNLDEYIELEYFKYLKDLNFNIFELNYGENGQFLIPSHFSNCEWMHKKFNYEKDAFIFSINHLIKRYDYIIFIDIEDNYSNCRLSHQINRITLNNKTIINSYENDFGLLEISSCCLNSRLIRRYQKIKYDFFTTMIYEIIQNDKNKNIEFLPKKYFYENYDFSKKLLIQNPVIGYIINDKDEGDVCFPNINIYDYESIKIAYQECDRLIFYNQIVFFISFYNIKSHFLLYQKLDMLEKLMNILFYYKLIIITNKESFEYIDDYKNRFPNIDFFFYEIENYESFKDEDNYKTMIDKSNFITVKDYFIVQTGQHFLLKHISCSKEFDNICYINIESVNNVLIDKNRIFRYIDSSLQKMFIQKNLESYIIPCSKIQLFMDHYKNIFMNNMTYTEKDILKEISKDWTLYDNLF